MCEQADAAPMMKFFFLFLSKFKLFDLFSVPFAATDACLLSFHGADLLLFLTSKSRLIVAISAPAGFSPCSLF